VLLVIDTLRADHVHAYGYERETTPWMDKLAGKGVLFERAVAASSWTQPSMASLLTSTYPMVHQVTRTPQSHAGMSVLPPDLVTISEFLKERGFATHAVSSHPYCSALSGFDQGFDGFDTVSEVISEYEAQEVMDRAIQWLSSQTVQSEFFLYVHIMGPHFPYVPPPEFQGRFTTERVEEVKAVFRGMDYKQQIDFMGAEGVEFFKSRPDLLAELIGLYDEEIAFSDSQVGRLWKTLESLGMLPSTMLIVLSDHGEGFLQHGRFGHGNSLFRELLEVPLIIYYPPLGEGVRVKGMVSLMDVFPAICALFRSAPPYPAQGSSLLPVIGGGKDHAPVLSELLIMGIARLTTHEHALIYRPRLKVQRQGRSFEEPEAIKLFNLNEDPIEMKDVSGQQPELAGSMVESLLRMEQENRRIKIAPAQSRRINEELRQKLMALGYLHH
jgi:arylsulfatase